MTLLQISFEYLYPQQPLLFTRGIKVAFIIFITATYNNNIVKPA